MRSQAITITHSESESRGRYEAHIEGKDGSGRLTYSRMSPTRIIADHTGVDDSLRGTGVARALVERLVADARSAGIRIVPQCSYVLAQYRRNPDWSDVMEE
jgi:predicted GNAT family acetyltransferase